MTQIIHDFVFIFEDIFEIQCQILLKIIKIAKILTRRLRPLAGP
nr:MAG TPA: hypothetical protein [Caudoviricetes sp.]DAV96893.1 MAG TPA: hypothetical protein [Caudoviricetes sp.]